MGTFGTTTNPAHYVEVPDPSNPGQVKRPAAGQVLQARSYPDGVALADIITGDYGYWSAVFATDAITVSGDSGVTWVGPLWSSESQAAASGAGALAAQAQASASGAQVAATAAQASAASAAVEAASAVKGTQVGIAGGVAPLGSDARVPITAVNQTILDRLDAVEGGAGSSGGLITPRWRFTTADGSLAAGTAGDDVWVPVASTMSLGPRLGLDDYGTTDTVVDVEANLAPDFTGWISLYGATKPTVPTSAYSALGLAPSTQGLPAGSLVRPKIVSVAPTSGGGGSAAAFKGTKTEYNTAAGAPASHAVPIPATGATGDTVLIVAASAGAVMSMPTGWVKALDVITDPADIRIRLAVFVAPWTSGMSGTITTASGNVVNAYARLITNAVPGNIGQIVCAPIGNGTGGTATIPLLVADRAGDLVIRAAVAKYALAVDGYTQTWTGGPATKVSDQITSRGSGAVDLGLAVGESTTAVASGATIAATNVAATGGTGSLGLTSWLTATILVSRAPSSHGPSTLTVQIAIQGG